MLALRWRQLLCLSSFAFSVACATPDPAADAAPTTDTKVPLGRAAETRRQLALDETRSSGRYTLATPNAHHVETVVQHFDEGFGWFSIVGHAADSQDSSFMLKSDERGAYGWLVYRDRDVAYEYTTDAEGVLQVQQVPVSKIFAVCEAPPMTAQDAQRPSGDEPSPIRALNLPAPPAKPFPSHVGSYLGGDVRKLQSRPEATKVWYIDITDVMDGDTPKAPQSKADVFEVWAITAATLYPFQVNVTTDADVYEKAGVQNSGCSQLIYEGVGDRSSCGLNVFGSRSCCNNHIYNDGYATGRILNHEAGHGWGLAHDGGDDGGEYFNGLSEFQWTPLMGNVWPGDRWKEALYQYSKGEYESATNHEDDFAIIGETLDYVDDDIPEATAITLNGTAVERSSNWGQIHRNTDSDTWTFVVGSNGHAKLKVDRIEDKGGSMLDVDASIVDSTGKELAHENPKAARYANLDVALPPGDYKLIIKGGAEGTPQDGFSNYSSIGLYAIEGTIEGSASPGAGAGGMGGAPASGGGGVVNGGAGAAGATNGGVGGTTAAAGQPTAPSAGTSTFGGGGSAAGSSAAGSGGSGPVVVMAPASNDPGGCGCRAAGSSSSPAWPLFSLLALFGVVRRKHRFVPASRPYGSSETTTRSTDT